MRRILSCVLSAVLFLSTSPFALAGESAPVAGDLRHLTFSATSGLWVRLLSPAPDSASLTPAAVVEAAVGMGQGVEVRINGDLVPTANLGKRVVDGPANQTRYTFYGVPLTPGPNSLVVTPLGAGSLRGTPVTATLYGPGPPTAFTAEILGKLVADGSSPLVLRVKAWDQWKHPAAAGSLVKVTIAGGDATLLPPVRPTDAPSPSASASASQAAQAPAAQASAAPSPDPSATPSAPAHGGLSSAVQSVDVVLESGGVANINAVAGLKSGDVTVKIVSDQTKAECKFFLSPNVRAPMVVGLATVGVGSVPGEPGEDPTAADGTNSRSGRVALYASGNIGLQTLGTLAYDTADTLARSTGYSAFGQGDALANRPYEVVGDASVPRDDALSSDHLYLRLDRGRSSAQWGEFQAQTGSSDGGDGFNLLVDGAKVELATNATKLMVFDASNDIAYAREIFNPLGLSTLGNLLHSDIVVGSDIVTLVTLSRSTGAILTQTTLTQNVDYSIDYNTGQIRFINIPLPFDANFNPNQIVIQYEYDGAAGNTKTTGGRFEAAFGRAQKEHVSVGYANDDYGTGNFSLLSENLGGVLPGGSWSLEHLTSDGVIVGDETAGVLGTSGSEGNALRASVHMGNAQNSFQAAFDSTTQGFDNPFGGLSTPGLVDYNTTFTHTMRNSGGTLTFNFSHVQNSSFTPANEVNGTAQSDTTTAQSQASLLWQKKMTKRLSVKAGVTAVTGPAPVTAASPAAAGVSSTSIQADVGFDWKLLPTVDLNVERTQDLDSGMVASQPAETQAELGVDFPRKGRAYIREMWSAAPVESFASSTASLTAPVSGTRTTDIGFQRSLGSATSLTTDYAVQQGGADGSDIYSSMGVDEKLKFGKHLNGDADVQRAIGIGSGAQGFNLYGLSLSYDLARLRTTGAYQLRTGEGGGSSLRLGATGMLSPDFSLIGLVDDSSAQGLMTSDQRIGLAYRPENNDRGVTLLQYELENSTSAQLGTHTATVSLDQAFHPTDRLELAARYAYKLDGDSYYPAQTQLYGFRVVQRVGDRFDIGGETRYLSVRNIPGASAVGFALESGLRLGDSLRFAFGYNFSGSPDPALAAAPTRRGVYVTMTSVIDRILGWGK